MRTERDSYLRMRIRQLNWLRLEHWRRWVAAQTLLRRAVLRSLLADAGVSRRQRAMVRTLYARLSRQGMATKHSSRCRVSGRARQVPRRLQLARMHLRQAMAEGRLGAHRLGRP